MHNHSKVQPGDLSRLERTVRSATKKAAEGAGQHHEQYTARTTSTILSVTPRSTGASTYRSTASSRAASSIPRSRVPPQQQQAVTSGDGLGMSRSRSRTRPSTAGSVTSCSHQEPRQQTPCQGGRGKLPSSRRSSRSEHVTPHFGGGGISIPKSIKNEWLILDTYQQLMADEKQAEEDGRAQAGDPEYMFSSVQCCVVKYST